MNQRKKPEVLTYIPAEDDEELENTPPNEADEFLRDVLDNDRGGEGYVIVKRHRKHGDMRQDHIGRYLLADYSYDSLIEMLTSDYGPGTYRLYVNIVQDGVTTQKKNIAVPIAAKLPGKEMQTKPANEFENQINSITQKLEELSKGKNTGVNFDQWIDRSIVLAGAFGPLFTKLLVGNKRDPMTDALNFLTLTGKIEKSLAPPEKSESEISEYRQLFNDGIQALKDLKLTTPTAKNESDQQLLAAPAQDAEYNEFKKLLDALLSVDFLKSQPKNFCDLLLRNANDVEKEIIKKLVIREDCYEFVLDYHYKFYVNRHWLGELLDHLQAGLGIGASREN